MYWEQAAILNVINYGYESLAELRLRTRAGIRMHGTTQPQSKVPGCPQCGCHTMSWQKLTLQDAVQFACGQCHWSCKVPTRMVIQASDQYEQLEEAFAASMKGPP